MNDDQKRLFLAVGLSAAVLFLFQTFFAPPKTVVDNATNEIATRTTQVDSKPIAAKTNGNSNNIAANVEPNTTDALVLKKYTINSKERSISITNQLGLVDFVNPVAKDNFKNTVGEKEAPFSILVKVGNAYKPISMAITQNAETITGTNSELGINFAGSLDEDGRFIYNLTSVTPYQYRLVFDSEEKSLDNRQVRSYAFLGGNDVERFDVGDEDVFDGQIKWVGMDFHFHLFSMVLDKKYATRIANKNGKLTVDFVEATQSLNTYFVYVKKNYDLLAGLGDKLQLSVDFGIFGIIAVPILRGIQFVYKYIPNYGIAIIILTILLRILTFPLYYKSIVSMKKMQKVQPELKKLKEKFKDDPQRMQKETMELFKRAGANPLGGCFPMLLQMPIFFAFYQVLYNAVELVNAPFMGWVQDLSIKDPLYILPVLMAIAMFGQQKLTPTTSADPTQQKIMMFMPLIFGFIMKDLPSGLVLYIFVSTLFGILQQLLVYKATD